MESQDNLPYIIFQDTNHVYTRTSDGIMYKSISAVLSEFKNPFQGEFWSLYKAAVKVDPDFNQVYKDELKYIRWDIDINSLSNLISQRGIDPIKLVTAKQEFLDAWELEKMISIDKGTQYHLAKEQEHKELGYYLDPITKVKHKVYIRPEIEVLNECLNNYVTHKNLYELEDGFYPELVLYYEEEDYNIFLCGTSDEVVVETVNNIRYIDISDSKTNKKIDKAGFFMRGGTQKMKEPLGHLEDCNLEHYGLQVSFYAWMLERQGYTVRNLSFYHFDKRYNVEYKKKEVEAVIDYYRNKKVMKDLAGRFL